MEFLLVVMACSAGAILLIGGLRWVQARQAQVLLRRAGEAAQEGQLDVAARLAQRALARTSDTDARVLAARIHHLSGDDDAAVACLLHERRVTAQLFATQVLLMQGRTDEASASLKATDEGPKVDRHQVIRAGLMALLFARQGDTARSRAAIMTASALMLRTGDRTCRFDAHLNMARAYRILGDARAAKAAASGALNLALFPIERHQARQLLAACLDDCGERHLSRRWHRKVVEDGIQSRFSGESFAALSA